LQKSTNDEIIGIANSIADEIFEELDDEAKIVLRGDCNLYFVPILVALQNAGMHEKIDTYFMERFKNGSSIELLLLYPEIAIFSTPKIEMFKAWFLACEESINTQTDWYRLDFNRFAKYFPHELQCESISEWFFRRMYYLIRNGGQGMEIADKFLFVVLKFKSPPPEIKELVKERFITALNNNDIQQINSGGLNDPIEIGRIELHQLMIILFPESYDLFVFSVHAFEEEYEDAVKSLLIFNRVYDLTSLLRIREISRDNHFHYHETLISIMIKVHLENRSTTALWEDNQIAVEDHLYWTLILYRNNPDLSYKPLISFFEYIFEKSHIPDAILRNLLIGNAHSINGVFECDLAIVLTIFKNRPVPEVLNTRLSMYTEVFEKIPLELQLVWLEFYIHHDIPFPIEVQLCDLVSKYSESEQLNQVLRFVYFLYKGKELPMKLRAELKALPQRGFRGEWKAHFFISVTDIGTEQKFNRVITLTLLQHIRNYLRLSSHEGTTYTELTDLKDFFTYIDKTKDLYAIEQLKIILYELFFDDEQERTMKEVLQVFVFIGHFLEDTVINSLPEKLRSGLIDSIEKKIESGSGYLSTRPKGERQSVRNVFYRKILKSFEEKVRYLNLHIKVLDKLERPFYNQIAPLLPDPDILIINKGVIASSWTNTSNNRKIYSNFFGRCEIYHRSELSQI